MRDAPIRERCWIVAFTGSFWYPANPGIGSAFPHRSFSVDCDSRYLVYLAYLANQGTRRGWALSLSARFYRSATTIATNKLDRRDAANAETPPDWKNPIMIIKISKSENRLRMKRD